ncbi:hypothetical protein DERP_012061 [Dermatophagoides pteronyssinus]|uniref:Uncharacterized protein n=1 Tax=Dermatophagoides pteronyssinus TaxID=6956 RepID=A0ABQ8ITV5_DERPT|nr:hypothetical protein DERP_012061 [Dermatophagoides pteronyssinus]
MIRRNVIVTLVPGSHGPRQSGSVIVAILICDEFGCCSVIVAGELIVEYGEDFELTTFDVIDCVDDDKEDEDVGSLDEDNVEELDDDGKDDVDE